MNMRSITSLLAKSLTLPHPIDSFDLTKADRQRLAVEHHHDVMSAFEGVPIYDRPDGESVYRFSAEISGFGRQSLCTPLSML